KICAFLVDFVRRYNKVMYEHRSSASYKAYYNHNERYRKHCLYLLLVDADCKFHCAYKRKYSQRSVNPKRNIYICIACSVENSRRRIKKFVLTKEKSYRKHNKEEHSYDNYLSLRYSYKLIDIFIIKLFLRTSCAV